MLEPASEWGTLLPTFLDSDSQPSVFDFKEDELPKGMYVVEVERKMVGCLKMAESQEPGPS